MVNTNIQGEIPLDGAGFVVHTKAKYTAGEYRRLVNCELLNGTIKNRRNVSSIQVTGNTPTPITNPQGFIGFAGAQAIVASKTTQRSYEPTKAQTLWSPTNLPLDASSGSWHNIVGFYRYNGINYWITHKFDNVGIGIHTIYLYYNYNNAFADLSTVVFTDLSRITAYTTSSEADLTFNGFFVQGERLWLCTSAGVYFSKATDHTVWSVPEGGFFKFQGQKINYAFFLQDTIFVLCDTAIFTINYSNDPNQDSVARQVSDAVGGEHGCVHLDTAYMINNTGIYAIHSNSVEKLRDNRFDLGNNDQYSRITSFEDYLIVTKFSIRQYDEQGIFGGRFWGNVGRHFKPYQNYNELGYNVYFINTVTGATHVLDFTDYREAAEKGYVVEVAVNPNKNFFGQTSMFLMTNRFDSQPSPTSYTYKGYVYTMATDYSVFQYDTAVASDGVVKRYNTGYDIEVEAFTPDGNEYLVKKFRNLELMGTLPFKDFEAKFAFDNKAYPASGIPLNVSQTPFGVSRPPYPCRVGINQRARSINIRLSSTNKNVSFPNTDIYDQLEISDIRLLWTYTGRGPETKVPAS